MDKINGARVREMAEWDNMSYGKIAKDLHVNHKLIHSFMKFNEITLTRPSNQSRAAQKHMRTRLLDVDDIREKAGAEGASFRSIAKSSNVCAETVIKFMQKHELELLKPCMRSESKHHSKDMSTRVLKLDDIREKAGAKGASVRNIAKSLNISTQPVIRFMREHEIELLKPSRRSASKRRSKDTRIDSEETLARHEDTSARVSIASLISSD